MRRRSEEKTVRSFTATSCTRERRAAANEPLEGFSCFTGLAETAQATEVRFFLYKRVPPVTGVADSVQRRDNKRRQGKSSQRNRIP